jgi:hypothetical protein
MGFRLDPLGAQMLGDSAMDLLESETPRLTVRPDFRILAPYGTPCFDRFRLAYFTVWEASRPAFCHRITQRALRRAQRLGIHRERIVGFLRRASAADLPPNVLHALTRQEK